MDTIDYSHDKYDLKSVIKKFPEQFDEGMTLADGVSVEGNFTSIMVSGMGGSTLPADVLEIFLDDMVQRNPEQKRVEVYRNRYYTLPPEAYSNCLNIVSSYSGNTEETISSFQECLDKGLPVVGMSAGGKIEEMCNEHGVPHIKIPFPFDLFQPRMATGYMFSALLGLLINQKMIQDCKDEVLEEAKKLEGIVESYEERSVELSQKLVGKTPVVYSTVPYRHIAMIWKIKFNEHGKTPAFWNYFPELNHNEMVGFTNPQGKFIFLLLKDEDEISENNKRFDVFTRIMSERGIDVETISYDGGSVFQKIFSSILLGDWTAYHLALRYGQDPTPVDMVEEFKDLLK